jgi:hypothetical protein
MSAAGNASPTDGAAESRMPQSSGVAGCLPAGAGRRGGAGDGKGGRWGMAPLQPERPAGGAEGARSGGQYTGGRWLLRVGSQRQAGRWKAAGERRRRTAPCRSADGRRGSSVQWKPVVRQICGGPSGGICGPCRQSSAVRRPASGGRAGASGRGHTGRVMPGSRRGELGSGTVLRRTPWAEKNTFHGGP